MTAGSELITVLIVDDHPVVRAGLTALLSVQPGLQVVGEAEDGHEAIAKVAALAPDVVLCDLRMGDGPDGVAVTRAVRRSGIPQASAGHSHLASDSSHPPPASGSGRTPPASGSGRTPPASGSGRTPPAPGSGRTPPTPSDRDQPTAVLILTTYDHDADLVRAVEAGAAGYLLKDADPADIVAAIQSAARGESLLGPELTRRVVETMRVRRADLSNREREVLGLVAEGMSNREVARRLVVSEATVKTHLNHVYAKLGADSRTAAVAAARSAGLLA